MTWRNRGVKMYSWRLPCFGVFFFPALFLILMEDFVCPLEIARSLKDEVWFMEHCIIFSQRGKNFAKLRHVWRVHRFCGRVESGTREMHCVNFGIQGETQTVSFLCHLERDRREPGALLLLWRASAFRNLNCPDYKLLNYTGGCPLKSVGTRKLKLAHSEWRRPVSKPLAMSNWWFCLLKKGLSAPGCVSLLTKSLSWLSWACYPREIMDRWPISSAPSRSTPLLLLLPLSLSYFYGSDEKWAGQRIKSNTEVLEGLLNTGVRVFWCPKSWTVISDSGETEAVKEGS